jgi:hypothetical protein
MEKWFVPDTGRSVLAGSIFLHHSVWCGFLTWASFPLLISGFPGLDARSLGKVGRDFGVELVFDVHCPLERPRVECWSDRRSRFLGACKDIVRDGNIILTMQLSSRVELRCTTLLFPIYVVFESTGSDRPIY